MARSASQTASWNAVPAGASRSLKARRLPEKYSPSCAHTCANGVASARHSGEGCMGCGPDWKCTRPRAWPSPASSKRPTGVSVSHQYLGCDPGAMRMDATPAPARAPADFAGCRCVHPGCRSEEHTSELQSPCNLVCRLLLEKKKNKESPILHLLVLNLNREISLSAVM